jgi:hypothetical protein
MVIYTLTIVIIKCLLKFTVTVTRSLLLTENQLIIRLR